MVWAMNMLQTATNLKNFVLSGQITEWLEWPWAFEFMTLQAAEAHGQLQVSGLQHQPLMNYEHK